MQTGLIVIIRFLSLSYSVAATYPHDTSLFTEGLEFYKGQLLESSWNLWKI